MRRSFSLVGSRRQLVERRSGGGVEWSVESGVEISGRAWGGWGPHAEGRTDGVRLGRCPAWRLVGGW